MENKNLQKSHGSHILFIIINFFIGLKYSILIDLIYFSKKFGNKYLYIATLAYINIIVSGIFTTLLTSILLFAAYNCYIEKINSQNIDSTIKETLKRITSLKYYKLIEEQLNKAHEYSGIEVVNTKINDFINTVYEKVMQYLHKEIESATNSILNNESLNNSITNKDINKETDINNNESIDNNVANIIVDAEDDIRIKPKKNSIRDNGSNNFSISAQLADIDRLLSMVDINNIPDINDLMKYDKDSLNLLINNISKNSQ